MKKEESITEDNISNDNVNNYLDIMRYTISFKTNFVLSSKLTNNFF